MTMGMRRAACAGVLLVGVALAGPSWAVNKCVGADGLASCFFHFQTVAVLLSLEKKENCCILRVATLLFVP